MAFEWRMLENCPTGIAWEMGSAPYPRPQYNGEEVEDIESILGLVYIASISYSFSRNFTSIQRCPVQIEWSGRRWSFTQSGNSYPEDDPTLHKNDQ